MFEFHNIDESIILRKKISFHELELESLNGSPCLLMTQKVDVPVKNKRGPGWGLTYRWKTSKARSGRWRTCEKQAGPGVGPNAPFGPLPDWLHESSVLANIFSKMGFLIASAELPQFCIKGDDSWHLALSWSELVTKSTSIIKYLLLEAWKSWTPPIQVNIVCKFPLVNQS